MNCTCVCWKLYIPTPFDIQGVTYASRNCVTLLMQLVKQAYEIYLLFNMKKCKLIVCG